MPIYLPKWIDFIAALYSVSDKERYCQRLYRRLKMNHSHVRKMIHHLERCCLIERVPERRIQYIVLTGKGMALAESALRMKSAMKEAGIDG